jgi:hypothetical protein
LGDIETPPPGNARLGIVAGNSFAAGQSPNGILSLTVGLDYLISNAGGASINYTVTPRTGSTYLRPVPPGAQTVFCGDGISRISAGGANSSQFWESGPHGSFLPSSNPTVQATPISTKVSSGYTGPSVIAMESAEAALVTGAGSVGPGDLVEYALSFQGPLTTSTDIGSYIAIKGATSGKYYAVCYVNQALSGTFNMVETGETLNIVAANADTVNHGAAGSFVAVTSP